MFKVFFVLTSFLVFSIVKSELVDDNRILKVCSCPTCLCEKAIDCNGHVFFEDYQCSQQYEGYNCCIRRDQMSDKNWNTYKRIQIERLYKRLNNSHVIIPGVGEDVPSSEPLKSEFELLEIELNEKNKEKVLLTIQLNEVKENFTKKLEQQKEKIKNVSNELESCQEHLEHNLEFIQILQNGLSGSQVETHELVEKLKLEYKERTNAILKQREELKKNINDFENKMRKAIKDRLEEMKKAVDKVKDDNADIQKFRKELSEIIDKEDKNRITRDELIKNYEQLKKRYKELLKKKKKKKKKRKEQRRRLLRRRCVRNAWTGQLDCWDYWEYYYVYI